MLRHGNQNLTLIMSFLCLIKYFFLNISKIIEMLYQQFYLHQLILKIISINIKTTQLKLDFGYYVLTLKTLDYH